MFRRRKSVSFEKALNEMEKALKEQKEYYDTLDPLTAKSFWGAMAAFSSCRFLAL